MRIWKYPLLITDIQQVEMPRGAKMLDVQVQHENAFVWALCDEAAPMEARSIAIYGTGNPILDDPGEYIATFQVMGGGLVFHAFEVSHVMQGEK